MTENQDRPPVTEGPSPFPGQQFPAAVLPTSEYPAAGDGQPEPVVFPPSGPFPAVQPKPRSRATTVLTVLAVVFFLGTGAFAALWLVEQGDHKGTTSQLETVRTDLTKTSDDLKNAEQARSQAESAKQRTQRDIEHTKPCLDSAKRFVRALTEADAEKQYDDMLLNC